jgi:NhaP-type Na+/H+ or K+/H+ antiporter
VLNQTLCDCFMEYGEVTSEMMMLLAEVIDEVQWGPALALAGLVIFVIRPLIVKLVLLLATLSWEARVFVAWFGPRGLNSLLLVLLVVHARLPEATELLATVGVVVLASVAIHGASAPFLSAWYGLSRRRQHAERGAREHRGRPVRARRGGRTADHPGGARGVAERRRCAADPRCSFALDVRA